MLLRLEAKEGVSKEEAFLKARERLETFLKTQDIMQVDIQLSEEFPKQNPKSGKFKHVMNMKEGVS